MCKKVEVEVRKGRKEAGEVGEKALESSNSPGRSWRAWMRRAMRVEAPRHWFELCRALQLAWKNALGGLVHVQDALSRH